MQTIIISGSRNPQGQTARAVEAVRSGFAAKGGQVETVFLPPLRIERCRQCEDNGWGLCRQANSLSWTWFPSEDRIWTPSCPCWNRQGDGWRNNHRAPLRHTLAFLTATLKRIRLTDPHLLDSDHAPCSSYSFHSSLISNDR